MRPLSNDEMRALHEADLSRAAFDSEVSPHYVRTAEEVWRAFHEASYDTCWYANCHPVAGWRQTRAGPRWHAGIWRYDYCCYREPASDAVDEVRSCYSPPAWTPDGAARLALNLLHNTDEWTRLSS